MSWSPVFRRPGIIRSRVRNAKQTREILALPEIITLATHQIKIGRGERI